MNFVLLNIYFRITDMPTSFRKHYVSLVDALPLTDLEKDIIKDRYMDIVTAAEEARQRTNYVYTILTNIITISGVLITAFVSFNKLSTENDEVTQIFLWVVWCLGIILTVANKWLYVFNVPRNYILNVVLLEKLYTEGWSFVSGIGRYKTDNHGLRFRLFCSRIEKIKLKSLECMPEMEYTEVVNDILTAGSGTDPQKKVRLSTDNIDDGNDGKMMNVIDLRPLNLGDTAKRDP
jgi:hypothetical protein